MAAREPDPDWRTRLVQRTAVPFGLAGILIATMAGGAFVSGASTRAGWPVELIAGVLGIASLAVGFAPLGAQTRARAFIALAMVAAVYGYASFGFLAGPALIGSAAVLFAGPILGRRAMAAVVAALALAISVIAWGMTRGWLPTPPAALTSPELPLPWVRTTVITVAFWSVLGVSLSEVIRQLEQSVNRERAEQAKRVRAEEERVRAEQVAENAQKLEAVGRLAAGVAHDFNNALVVIQSWNDLRNEAGATAEDQAEAAEAIRAACAQAGGLAKQLLVFAKSAPRAPRSLSLARVVEASMKTLRRVIPEDLTLAHESSGEPWVFADEVQIQQIVLNLALNARDATQASGAVTMRTRVEQVDEVRQTSTGPLPLGRYAVVEIEDTGAGMSEETLARAFDPFFSTKTPSKGTGLGLATVRTVVDEHGGRIDLASEPGKGTRVTVFLPASDRTQTPPRSAARDPSAPCSSGVILLVEDDHQVRPILERTLRSKGYRITVSSDGDEALLEIGRGQFDLLCTDAVMPGAPLSEIIAAFERKNPEANVLVCSGYVEEELTRRGIEQGKYKLLAKPFSPEQLVAAVEVSLAERPAVRT